MKNVMHKGAMTGRSAVALMLAAGILSAGCQSSTDAKSYAANPALRRLDVAAGASAADADRAALSRLVGVWSFEGWSADASGTRRPAAGRAAGAIEDEHFVLLDFEAISGDLAGKTSRKGGSMMFASEPGLGVTLSAWGDASPSISRFVGSVEGNGSAIVLRESRPVAGRNRHSAVVRFETDDRWSLEVRDESVAGMPVVASYTMTRAAN